jgi:DNA-binding GntR family transcriptional regulator
MENRELSERLAADRVELGRVSTTERVADVLRSRIIEGVVEPGERLSEEKLREGLPVSRNTLREAFRLLSHEGLLVHEFNRGVFVRRLTAADVADIYAMRRALECYAVRLAGDVPAAAIARVGDAVREGERAAEVGRWGHVGTANMRFHQALTALAGSPRMDETMRRLLAEGRLAFHAVVSWEQFHEPFLARNRTIFEKLEARDLDTAERELRDYLDTAEEQLAAAFADGADRPVRGRGATGQPGRADAGG